MTHTGAAVGLIVDWKQGHKPSQQKLKYKTAEERNSTITFRQKPDLVHPVTPETTSSDLVMRGVCTADGRTTTIKLEPEFWDLLQEICTKEGKSLNAMVRHIDGMRGASPRASAIRVFILKYLRSVVAFGSECPISTDHGPRLSIHSTTEGESIRHGWTYDTHSNSIVYT